MVPLIGFMVGSYILMRGVDVFCRPKESFSSSTGKAIMLISAMVTTVVTAFCMFGLLFSGSSSGLRP